MSPNFDDIDLDTAWQRAEDDGFREPPVEDPPKEYDDLGTPDR